MTCRGCPNKRSISAIEITSILIVRHKTQVVHAKRRRNLLHSFDIGLKDLATANLAQVRNAKLAATAKLGKPDILS